MTPTAENHPVVQPAKPELAALARTMRPDWDATVLDDALMAAAQAGWSWEQAAKYVWRLLWRPDAEPRELRDAARIPARKPGDPSSPGPEYAAIKARTLERLATAGQHHEDEPAA